MPRLAPVTSATLVSAIAASWDSHRLCVYTRAQHRARQVSGHLVVGDHLAAADEDVSDPRRFGVEAAGASGHVEAGPGGLAANVGRVEDNQVGDPPLGHPPPVAQAVEAGGDV